MKFIILDVKSVISCKIIDESVKICNFTDVYNSTHKFSYLKDEIYNFTDEICDFTHEIRSFIDEICKFYISNF